MEREKRRRQREAKRRHQQRKKHELRERIRILSQQCNDSWKQWLVVRVIWKCISANVVAPPRAEGSEHRKLSLDERQYIYLWTSQGYGVREIARRLGRSPSTISRELRRNRPLRRIHGMDPYSRAKQAHDIALSRRQKGRRGRIRLRGFWIQGVVHQGIQDGYTPEFISARLWMEHGVQLSHEAIYRWIYEVERALIEYLPRKGKPYRRGGKKRGRALPQPAAPKRSIDKRMKAANKRREFGHWEFDTVVSRQSKTCLLVLQERVSRFFFVVKLPCCTAEEASRAVIELLKPLGTEWVKSLTCDNGAENSGHEMISRALGVPVYFCHPYCSSERGGVENRNGVLRRFFPKQTDFENVSDEELERVWKHLINRPMRCLGYFTPSEIMSGQFEPILKMAA